MPAQADGLGGQRRNAVVKLAELLLGLLAEQRVLVVQESVVNLGPIVRSQHLFGDGNEITLFGSDVVLEPFGVIAQRLSEFGGCTLLGTLHAGA